MNTYQYTVKGVDYEVEIVDVDGNVAKVNVNGIPFEVEMKQPINAARNPHVHQKPADVVAPVADARTSAAPTSTQAPTAAQPATGAQPAAGNAIKAPLPGTITDVKVQVGQQVNVGDTVVVLEAMKMQNNIEAEFAGTVTSIAVRQGDTVMEGAVIMTIG